MTTVNRRIERNKRIARRIPEGLAIGGDLDLIDELYAADAVDPTGGEFEVGDTVFTRLDDGRVAEGWVQPDTLGLLQQLGIASAPLERR